MRSQMAYLLGRIGVLIQSHNRGTGHRKLDLQLTNPVSVQTCQLKSGVN